MTGLTESQIKYTVGDFLQYEQNAGNLYFDRLNSGEFIEVRGQTRRRIIGCRKGTADLFILIKGRIIFLEIKSTKGKLRTEQRCFKTLVESQGAEYYVLRDVEELGGILYGRKCLEKNQ